MQTRESNSGKLGKRNRPPYSCEPCRTRKLKCNRGSPCDSCVKRNKESSCEYADNANRNKPKHGTGDRLQNLENIVLQFLQKEVTGNLQGRETENLITTDHPEVSTVTDTLADEYGTLHIRGGQMNYVDSTHWFSILRDIEEVREQLSLSSTQVQEEQSSGVIASQPEVDLIFDPPEQSTVREVLQSLPPRSVCDSLLSQYFNSEYTILPILHPLQFQKEYEQFWQDSSKSSTIWIGLLFSILGIAATLRQITNMPADSGGHVISPKTFRLRTTQCLVLGKYSSAKAYALETLVLHLYSSFLGLEDSNINLWFFMGIIIRLAMRMGYHRDSRSHPSISPFEGEMRRRLWAIIYQMDVLMSFQLGLPSMIPATHCDTEAPRNLNFSDFLPNTAVLPPTRALSDHTSILYFILKGKIMDVFRKIVAHTQSLSSPPLEATIILDIEMRETYNNIPPAFQMMPVSRSFMDTSSTIMKRCSMELLYLKGIIVLHRRYLSGDTSDPKCAKFRRACLDAAMKILSRQADLHQASQPGGQLCDDRWMVSSLMAYDFLLAAMVVCLELSVHMRNATTSRNADFDRQFDALQTSYTIWTSRDLESKETRTAAQVLELMIRTVKDDSVNSSSSSAALPQEDGLFLEDSDLPYAKPVSEMISGSESLNWTLLDQYFQGSDRLHDTTSPLDTYSEEQSEDLLQSMGLDWMS